MPMSPAAPDAPSPDVLIVVATRGEAAHLRDLAARVIVSGVGPVAAALATAHALTAAPARLVISAGIGGAYPGGGLHPGDLAVSSVMIQADLGPGTAPPSCRWTTWACRSCRTVRTARSFPPGQGPGGSPSAPAPRSARP